MCLGGFLGKFVVSRSVSVESLAGLVLFASLESGCAGLDFATVSSGKNVWLVNHVHVTLVSSSVGAGVSGSLDVSGLSRSTGWGVS